MVAPSSVSVIGGEVVFLEGVFRFSEATVTSVQCVFDQGNVTFTVTATNYTNTGITCVSPSGAYNSGSNDTFVYIAVNGKTYTNQLPFEFYGTPKPPPLCALSLTKSFLQTARKFKATVLNVFQLLVQCANGAQPARAVTRANLKLKPVLL